MSRATQSSRSTAPRRQLRSRLEARHLRMVQQIALQRSVTRAARELNLSQSALSHQLLNLERDLAVTLFHRVGKTMTATAAGERLLKHAERILGDLAQAEADVRLEHDEGRQTLRLATSCYTHYVWLAPALAAFGTRHPRLDPRIVFQSTRNEIAALTADEIDVAITTRPAKDPLFACEALFSDLTVAVVAAKAPLAGGPSKHMRWDQLADQTLLIHDIPDEDEDRLRHAIIAASGRGPAAAWRVQLTEGLIQLARAGQGIGIVGARMISGRPRTAGLTVKALSPAYHRRYWALWRSANPRRLPIDELVRAVKETVR